MCACTQRLDLKVAQLQGLQGTLRKCFVAFDLSGRHSVTSESREAPYVTRSRVLACLYFGIVPLGYQKFFDIFSLEILSSNFREVQLKSPNWLYGQPKPVGATSSNSLAEQGAAKKKLTDSEKEFSDLDWLASLSPDAEEELFSK